MDANNKDTRYTVALTDKEWMFPGITGVYDVKNREQAVELAECFSKIGIPSVVYSDGYFPSLDTSALAE